MTYILLLLVSFVLTAVGVLGFIRYMKQREIGQITREEGPLWHEVKTGTPTMGGTIFVLVIAFMSVITTWLTGNLDTAVWILSLTFLLFGGIGFVDDFISVFQGRNEGLTAKQKFILQVVFSIFVSFVAFQGGIGYMVPFFGYQIQSGILVALFTFFWITGFSNAVNLTDGLDGLATGLSIIAFAAYGIIAYRQGQASLAMVCGVAVVCLLAFLMFNKKPAKIFMGDVGSLALGASLAVLSLLTGNPWSLLVIGLVFVVETASVILQVLSFKLTGKRIFKMSPIHHHFELSGWSETKVVSVFWLVGLVATALYLVWAW